MKLYLNMHTTQRYLINTPFRYQWIRFITSKSYFDVDREDIIQRTKYKKRNGEQTLSIRDITIPQSQIRQFIKLVHPDRFQSFINNNNTNILYTLDQIKMMQQINESNLSTLNSILEFSRKHSKLIQTELFKNSKVISDRKMTQDAPNPTNFEFYIEKRLHNSETNGIYFEQIQSKFNCEIIRPFISEYYKILHKTLNELFMCCNIEINTNVNEDGETVKKFSDLDLDKAMKMANNGSEGAQDIINDVFTKHLSKETEQKNRLYGINAMKYKFENGKVYFGSNLNEEHINAIMNTLYKASGEFPIDLVFDLWKDVPIMVCKDEMECLKCPDYIVAVPWYCDYEEFVLYIQDQIVLIAQNYNKQKAKLK
eukprot:344714_1